jgi:hypothetical protein
MGHMLEKRSPHSFGLAKKLHFMSVDMQTLRIMGIGMKKIPQAMMLKMMYGMWTVVSIHASTLQTF